MVPGRTSAVSPAEQGPADEEEDDYMSMSIVEPSKQDKESSIQRRARKALEGEIRGRVKSKQEREAAEAAAREAALATALDTSNKGYKMMAKLGYKAGGALGKSSKSDEGARTEPIGLVMKEDRGGIGMDTEKKRKFREEMAHEVKKAKAEEGEYRERVRREREEKRLEGQILGAQKVAERLDTEAEEDAPRHMQLHAHGDCSGEDDIGFETGDAGAPGARSNTLTKQINVLWRGLVRHRLATERERRMRYDLQQSLSRLPTYEDPDEDRDDKLAMGKEEEELEEEDAELDEFNALEPSERLAKLLTYLRDTYNYCFWCKFRYPDAELEGCPGLTEDEHG